MKISDCKFQHRRVNSSILEALITTPNGQVFGIFYQALNKWSDIAIFTCFTSNPSVFFIDVETVTEETVAPKESIEPLAQAPEDEKIDNKEIIVTKPVDLA